MLNIYCIVYPNISWELSDDIRDGSYVLLQQFSGLFLILPGTMGKVKVVD